MNWQKEAINDLKAYEARKNSVVNMREKICELEGKAVRLKSVSNDVPVQGGASKNEDMLISNIVERDKLKENIRIAQQFIESVERGLAVLSADERKVLDGFYIAPVITYKVERLCDELHFEKSRIYQIKDTALRRFTIAMYGIIDL